MHTPIHSGDPVPVQDGTPEPEDFTNEQRAARVQVVLEAHQVSMGEQPDQFFDTHALASLLADMRHWCDRNDVAWDDAVAIADEHYLAEQPCTG